MCPFCKATVEIPPTHRALRDEQLSAASRPRMLELFRKLGKRPPMFVRAFAFFDNVWFIYFGLGFWIAAGVAAGVLLPIRIGLMFDVNVYDVWSEARQTRFTFGVPIGSIVLGILLAGWARKRAVGRGGLQAALASAPPARTGGPRSCRVCGAPLMVEAAALGARCTYCQADNLVEMPDEWVARMKKHTAKVGEELDSAEQAFDAQRRSLRTSLIVRSVVISLVLGPVIFLLLQPGHERSPSAEIFDASQRPQNMPSWESATKSRAVDLTCTPLPAYRKIQALAEHCSPTHCTVFELVPLRRGERLVIASSNLPAGSEVALEIHDRTLMEDRWVRVDRGPIDLGQTATLRATRSGWYRFRVAVASPKPRWWSFCATVR